MIPFFLEEHHGAKGSWNDAKKLAPTLLSIELSMNNVFCLTRELVCYPLKYDNNIISNVRYTPGSYEADYVSLFRKTIMNCGMILRCFS